MRSSYQIAPHNPKPTEDQPEKRYRGVSYLRPIDAAKDKVRCIDLADLLCGAGKLRRRSKEWVGHCPLPDHEDKTPSFTVNPEKDVFFCHGCLRGGDVVELARLYWGFAEREAHAAAGHLLLTFGHTPPERPPSWSRKQHRQAKVRDLADEARIEAMTRRLWRYVFKPIVMEIEDVEERKRMAERLYPKVKRQARYMVSERRKANR